MPAGKVVSLKVTPSQSAMLCFSVDGIIGQSDIQLGQPVTQFDLASFYDNLGTTVAGNPARLVYDSQAISTDKAVLASTLMTLRAEPRKALLDKAIGARENAYYQKYANQAEIIALQRTFYDLKSPGCKYGRLGALRALAQEQANLLMDAYQQDKRTGVVKTTQSALSSLTTTSGGSIISGTSSGSTNSTGSNLQENTTISISRFTTSGSQAAGMDSSGTLTKTGTSTKGDSREDELSPTVQTFVNGHTQLTGTNSGLARNSGAAEQQQTILNTDYAYRVPNIEAVAQNHRSQISLMDEQFTQFMFVQNLPYLEQVFANELQAIDLDVKRFQVAYLDTILMPPIEGIVTGIFKQLGEGVRAGEAAIRVENNTSVLIVGTLIYRGMVSLGANVTITSTLFSEPAPTVIAGTIVAAQGHPSEDDWWDVVINCNNVDNNGNPILPLFYRFDFDDTTVVIA
jgi:hypothetical protein